MKVFIAFAVLIAVAAARPGAPEDAVAQVLRAENVNDGVNPWHNR